MDPPTHGVVQFIEESPPHRGDAYDLLKAGVQHVYRKRLTRRSRWVSTGCLCSGFVAIRRIGRRESFGGTTRPRCEACHNLSRSRPLSRQRPSVDPRHRTDPKGEPRRSPLLVDGGWDASSRFVRSTDAKRTQYQAPSTASVFEQEQTDTDRNRGAFRRQMPYDVVLAIDQLIQDVAQCDTWKMRRGVPVRGETRTPLGHRGSSAAQATRV